VAKFYVGEKKESTALTEGFPTSKIVTHADRRRLIDSRGQDLHAPAFFTIKQRPFVIG